MELELGLTKLMQLNFEISPTNCDFIRDYIHRFEWGLQRDTLGPVRLMRELLSISIIWGVFESEKMRFITENEYAELVS